MDFVDDTAGSDQDVEVVGGQSSTGARSKSKGGRPHDPVGDHFTCRGTPRKVKPRKH